MDRREMIKEGLRYIEENLKAPITAVELADMAGYSLYRYYRLFQSEVGMPVMRYILQRRLLGAASEIRQGARQIDTALAYGFETHAWFYRAFRREFGCTSSQYIRAGRVPGALPAERKGNNMKNDRTKSGRPLPREFSAFGGWTYAGTLSHIRAECEDL